MSFLKSIHVAALALAAVAIPVVAGAQEVDLEQQIKNSKCVQALKGCDRAAIQKSFQDSFKACGKFRSCKKACRQTKRSCNADARSEKSDCKHDAAKEKSQCMAQCGGKKGSAKRKCKRACRKEARHDKRGCRKERRADRRECRNAKKSCVDVCRDDLRGACWAARHNAAKAVGKCAKKALPACGLEIYQRVTAP